MKEKGRRPQADHTSPQTGFEAHESVDGVRAWLGVSQALCAAEWAVVSRATGHSPCDPHRLFR